MIFAAVSQFHIYLPCLGTHLSQCHNSVLIVEVLVVAFNRRPWQGPSPGTVELREGLLQAQLLRPGAHIDSVCKTNLELLNLSQLRCWMSAECAVSNVQFLQIYFMSADQFLIILFPLLNHEPRSKSSLEKEDAMSCKLKRVLCWFTNCRELANNKEQTWPLQIELNLQCSRRKLLFQNIVRK